MTFDLGGVLVEWDPRRLYRKLLPAAEVEPFLAEVCTHAWNQRQDAGRPVAEAIEELAARFPDRRALIAAYYERFDEMLGDLIDANLALLAELSDRGVGLYALTNWSAEMFPHLERRPDAGFLERFDGIVVSGREGVRKPDPAIFELLCRRYRLEPAEVLFIDDVEENCAGARAAGLRAIRYDGSDLGDRVRAWVDAA